jgi:hypothetical protein
VISDRDIVFIVGIGILIVSYVIVFILGLIIGRLWSNVGVYNNSPISKKPSSFFDKEVKKSISIDETKFVGDIKTEGLEKKYANIAEEKTTTSDIQTSIDKLKNLKR